MKVKELYWTNLVVVVYFAKIGCSERLPALIELRCMFDEKHICGDLISIKQI